MKSVVFAIRIQHSHIPEDFIVSETKPPEVGTISWADLTVKDAVTIRDFYSKVVNWPFESVDMGDYPTSACSLPRMGNRRLESVMRAAKMRGFLLNGSSTLRWPIWKKAPGAVVELGGKVLSGPHMAGQGRFVVIKDPAGAVAALFETLPKNSS